MSLLNFSSLFKELSLRFIPRVKGCDISDVTGIDLEVEGNGEVGGVEVDGENCDNRGVGTGKRDVVGDWSCSIINPK